jgi:hypothetical protein
MSDIQKISVFDERIVQQAPVQYAVEQGALSVTNTNFNALAQSNSQHTYQIQVPSENIFIDKALDWTSTVLLAVKVQVSGAPVVDSQVVVLGRDIALSAFPLHSLVSTLSATINDTTVTMNTSDVLHEILRLADSAPNRELRTCPTYLDTYQNYNDAVTAVANPLAGYEASSTSSTVTNGAYYNVQFCDAGGKPLGLGTKTGGGVVNSSYPDADGNLVYYYNYTPVQHGAVEDTEYNVYIKFTSTEKLVLSPFCWNDVHDKETGLFGIQNISITMNMLQPSLTNTAGRVLRSQNTNGRNLLSISYRDVNGSGFSSSQVSCVFMTPSFSLPLPSTSVVPYMEFPRYTQSFSVGSSDPIASGGTLANQTSQTITLPCIPDLIIIYAKPKSYAVTDADWYLPITQISVNFDNFSGLLSSLTPSELFSISQANGLQMDYNQWNGQAINGNANSGTKQDQFVGLTGFGLVLKPSRDITLQSGQAPSLVGNYTLQFNYSLYNPSKIDISEWNLTVVTANSGFFESTKGSSRVVKGVLSAQDILNADSKGSLTRSQLNRYVGGRMSGLHKALSNGISKAKPVFSNLMSMAQPIISNAKDALGAMTGRISKRLM